MALVAPARAMDHDSGSRMAGGSVASGVPLVRNFTLQLGIDLTLHAEICAFEVLALGRL